VNALAEYCEEAIHDVVEKFGVDLTRELHGSFDVDEQHRDVLALSLERRA
jgi:hypothetical protein